MSVDACNLSLVSCLKVNASESKKKSVRINGKVELQPFLQEQEPTHLRGFKRKVVILSPPGKNSLDRPEKTQIKVEALEIKLGVVLTQLTAVKCIFMKEAICAEIARFCGVSSHKEAVGTKAFLAYMTKREGTFDAALKIVEEIQTAQKSDLEEKLCALERLFRFSIAHHLQDTLVLQLKTCGFDSLAKNVQSDISDSFRELTDPDEREESFVAYMQTNDGRFDAALDILEEIAVARKLGGQASWIAFLEDQKTKLTAVLFSPLIRGEEEEMPSKLEVMAAAAKENFNQALEKAHEATIYVLRHFF